MEPTDTTSGTRCRRPKTSSHACSISSATWYLKGGSWSWNGRETWEKAIDLLDRGIFDLDPVITNHYGLEEWETAFANLRAKQDVKAFIHPNGRGWI